MTALVKERTYTRDVGLKVRHEAYGVDCPAIDLDHIVVEYDTGVARALIEYKHEKSRPQFITHPNFRALIDLSDRAEVPAFAARYADEYSWFQVVPLNDLAKEKLRGRPKLSEPEFIEFLYGLRDRPVPSGLIENLGVSI